MRSNIKTKYFKTGYLDGMSAFSFVVIPVKGPARVTKVPTVKNTWTDVGRAMRSAFVDFSNQHLEKKGKNIARR